ncbi:MAG: flagellar protein FlaG [Gammaproteobacteria bacterium]
MEAQNVGSGAQTGAPVEAQSKAKAKELETATARPVEAPSALEKVQDLAKAVEVLNEALSKDPVSLRFTVDETLNRPVITVVSEKTGEIIHQLPQEDVLRAVKNIDRMRGILFEDRI